MEKPAPLAVALLLASLVAVPAARAEDARIHAIELMSRLGKTTGLDCAFTDKASGRWDAGGTPKLATMPAPLKMAFTHVNIDESTAEALGIYGASYIVVRYSGPYLNLIQQQGDGPLYVTTVFADETVPGRLKAVQARLEYTAGSVPGFTSEPELYFGSCAIEAPPSEEPAPDVAPQAGTARAPGGKAPPAKAPATAPAR